MAIGLYAQPNQLCITVLSLKETGVRKQDIMGFETLFWSIQNILLYGKDLDYSCELFDIFPGFDSFC